MTQIIQKYTKYKYATNTEYTENTIIQKHSKTYRRMQPEDNTKCTENKIQKLYIYTLYTTKNKNQKNIQYTYIQ